MSDPILDFVEQSHNEQGQRTELRMRKEAGGAGFYIRAKGGKEAIKELEKMMYSAIGQIAWSLSIETGRMPDKMSIDFLDWQVPPEVKKTWTDWAALHLQSEGKIGPDAKPRSWQITEERKDALKDAISILEEAEELVFENSINVLRAMLREAE